MKIYQLTLLLFVVIGLPSAACSQDKQFSNQAAVNQGADNQTATLKIPSDVKNSTYDSDVNKENSLFIKISADNKMYVRKPGMSEFKDGKLIRYDDYNLLTDADFVGETIRLLQAKTPDKRIIYIQAHVNAKFGKLTEIFEKSAKNEIFDQIKFIVNPLKEVGKAEETDSGGYVLTLILPGKKVQTKNDGQTSGGIGNGREMSPPPMPPPGFKPKQKSVEEIANEEKAKQLEIEKAEGRKKIKIEKLSVELDNAGKIKFNNKAQTPDEFSVNLKKIFDERTAYDIFRDGTNEIEKTVYLKISPNVNYGDAIKLIDKIYGLGANLLYLEN